MRTICCGKSRNPSATRGSAANPPTAVNLIVDGTVVRTTTGQDGEALNWTNWSVAEYKDKTARIDIVDENTGGCGHILAFTDDLHRSADLRFHPGAEHGVVVDQHEVPLPVVALLEPLLEGECAARRVRDGDSGPPRAGHHHRPQRPRRAHDRERRLEKLRLRRYEAIVDEFLQHPTGCESDRCTDDETANSTDEKTEETEQNREGHAILFRNGRT